MKDSDKRQLVCLLRKYQAELLEADMNNKQVCEKHKRWTKEYYEQYKNGVKAQYDHARIIADKLDYEIAKGIKTY